MERYRLYIKMKDNLPPQIKSYWTQLVNNAINKIGLSREDDGAFVYCGKNKEKKIEWLIGAFLSDDWKFLQKYCKSMIYVLPDQIINVIEEFSHCWDNTTD